MTHDRDRIRAKQDSLLDLCKCFPRSYRISAEQPGSPTLAELGEFVFPEWESLIDRIIAERISRLRA